MKKLLSIAILAAAFTFTSCGNKPADANAATTTATSASTTTPTPAPAPAPAPTPAADASLSGRAAAAICNCPAMKELGDVMKEMEANKAAPDKAMTAKMTEIAGRTKACTEAIQAEVDALSPDDKKKVNVEMEEKIKATCPDLMPKR